MSSTRPGLGEEEVQPRGQPEGFWWQIQLVAIPVAIPCFGNISGNTMLIWSVCGDNAVDVYVPQNLHVEILIPNMMVL